MLRPDHGVLQLHGHHGRTGQVAVPSASEPGRVLPDRLGAGLRGIDDAGDVLETDRRVLCGGCLPVAGADLYSFGSRRLRQQRLAGPRLHHYPAGRIHEVRDVHMASLVVACLQQDVPQEGNQSICRAVGAVCDRRGAGDGRQGPRHGHDSGLHRRRGLSDRRVPRQMDGSRRIGRGGYGRCIGGFQPEPLASYSGHIWRLLGR